MIIFLHCTWCILQNLCGLAVFAACRKYKRFRFGKAAVATVWRLPYGLSLGAFIFVPDEKKAQTLNHEYGHTMQSLILGPLYLPIIAIPSALWCILPPFILFFNLPIDNVYRKIRRFCEAAWRRSRRKSRTILIPSKPSALTYRFLSGNQYIDIVYILIRN